MQHAPPKTKIQWGHGVKTTWKTGLCGQSFNNALKSPSMELCSDLKAISLPISCDFYCRLSVCTKLIYEQSVPKYSEFYWLRDCTKLIYVCSQQRRNMCRQTTSPKKFSCRHVLEQPPSLMPVNNCGGCGTVTVPEILALPSSTLHYPCDDCKASGAWVQTPTGGWKKAQSA